jgi:two-component system response regulator DegU
MRDGIEAILRHSDEFEVQGEAESGTEAVQICKKRRPDISLMDIGLPGLNGIETTTEILRHYPDVKIILLSMYDDEHSVVSAIRSGARAFVLKKASDGDLLDALRAVAKGGSYLSPQVSDRLLHRIQRGDGIETGNLGSRRSLAARNCRFCAWWPKAKPAKRSRLFWILVCKRCAAIGKR